MLSNINIKYSNICDNMTTDKHLDMRIRILSHLLNKQITIKHNCILIM